MTVRLTFLAHLVLMRPSFQGLKWFECDGLGVELLLQFLFHWWPGESVWFYFQLMGAIRTRSGFGGSRGSVLAFGTQVRGFKPGRDRRIFKDEKILSKPSFGGEVKPSVPCRRFAGMLKTPGNYMEVGFSGEICRPFLAHFRSSLPEGSHVAWCGAPLGLTGGTKGGAQRVR